jgi:DNA-directed RNA polymerase subunit N (RpoN/RPB10)
MNSKKESEQSMKMNCLSCGHTLDLGDAYDDYQGPIRCFVCGALLGIKTTDGQMKSSELAKDAGAQDALQLETAT